jgi:hypothetical protein
MHKKRLLMISGLSAVLLVAVPALAYTYTSKVTISYVQDASATINTGTLVIGDDGSTSDDRQVAIDNNEIQARDGSAGAQLSVQHDGGDLLLTAGGGDLSIGSPNLFLDRDLDIWDKNGASLAQLGANNAWFSPITFYDYTEFDGSFYIYNLPASGSTSTLCRNGLTFQVGSCSSSRRFKTDIADLTWGLREVLAMKPVSFAWKASGQHDVGFIAEDALSIVPELVEHGDDGAVSGFNYGTYTAVLTRAIQEQQNTIEDQRVELNTTQQAVTLRDKEIAEVRDELAVQKSTNADQTAELKKLRDEVSALSRAVASMSARP